MQRRLLGIALALGLVASVFSAMPVRAQDAPVRDIPADPNIVDDKQDSNYLTPQGGPSGGVYHTRADIWAAWFTEDVDSIYVHIQTELGGRSNFPYFYRVRVAPGGGDDTCLWFTGTSPSAADPGEPSGQLRDVCDGDERTPVEFLYEQAPDESGVYTIKVPRDAHPALADGSVLATPWAEVTQYIGSSASGGATFPPIDATEPGRDYVIGSGDEEASEEPPGKSDPPGKGKKKGCPKGKGKKKGACPGEKGNKGKKGKAADTCEPYQPGEMGAEVEEETTIVTDAATEEEPIEMEFDFAPAGGSLGPHDTTVHIPHNIQVDSEADETGLWVRLETPPTDDPDLYVYWPNGSEAARAAGFNQAPVLIFDGTGNGGHSEVGAEQIDGIRTADCTGYTLDLVNWLGQGGTYTLKLWLGDIENDPKPPE